MLLTIQVILLIFAILSGLIGLTYLAEGVKDSLIVCIAFFVAIILILVIQYYRVALDPTLNTMYHALSFK